MTMVQLERQVAEEPPLHMDGGGTVRVGGTRVTLDSVVYAFDEGASPEEIAQRFPSVDLADVYGAIYYYLRCPDEVRSYLREREAEAEQVRRECEARHPQGNLRERLLARRALKAQGP